MIGPPWQSNRGAQTASWTLIPKSSTLTITCATAVTIRVAPGAPTTSTGWPSR